MANWKMLLPRKDDWEHLREVCRQLWNELAFLQGRLGPVTIKNDLTVEGNITADNLQPTVVSITTTPYTTSYTIQDLVEFVLIDATTDPIDLFLPDQPASGRKVWVKKKDPAGSTITVYGLSNSEVEGATSYAIDKNNPLEGFVYDGSDWWIFTT
jgi:hypothetical protein